jgi:uncharacterized membrane protein
LSLNTFLYLFHIAFAMLLVAGIVGRQITRHEVHRAADLQTFKLLVRLAGRFEALLVRPSSLGVVLVGIFLAVRQGWPIFGILEGASTNWLLVSNMLLIAMILVILLIFVPRGKDYERLLAEAELQGQITPALRASMDDPVVRAGHWFEGFALLAIIVLMTTKPF